MIESREKALDLCKRATDEGHTLSALVYALVYVGDAVRMAAGHQVDTRVYEAPE